MELEEGLNRGFLPVNISNGDGSVDEIGVVRYCRRPKFHGFPSFKDLSISFLAMPTEASSKSIALWMVWAAGDMVHLIEIQEVVELPGTVTRSIVQS